MRASVSENIEAVNAKNELPPFCYSTPASLIETKRALCGRLRDSSFFAPSDALWLRRLFAFHGYGGCKGCKCIMGWEIGLVGVCVRVRVWSML